MLRRLSPVLETCEDGTIYLHWCVGCDQYHGIDVGAPNSRTGARWTFDGNVEKPTFSPSINIVGQCHYFIRNGQIEYCSDSKHELAGKTVELSPLPD